ncbi:MAG: DMT family transporter [Ramlibacter sp.]|nr:DMT family transporter [Ramlibacter sp.]
MKISQDFLRNGRMEMIAAMVLSGTIGFFVLESGQQPFNVVFFRCLIGAGCLLVYCLMRGFFKDFHPSIKDLMLLGLGGVALVLNWVALFASYSRASIGISTVIYHVQPFFVFFAGALFFGERITLSRVFWLALAFGGALLIINPSGTEFTLDSNYLTGCGLALLAALLYAVATIVTKRLKGIRPHLIALLQMSLGILMLLPLANFQTLPVNSMQWGSLVTLGVVHSCLMYILMYSAFQKLPASGIAVLSFIYPAVAMLVDFLAYGRTLTPLQLGGAVLILIAGASNNLNLSPTALFARNRSLDKLNQK